MAGNPRVISILHISPPTPPCLQAFNLDSPQLLDQKGIDAGTLFGNIGEIIEISDRFLASVQLEVNGQADPCQQLVGRCFLATAEAMRTAYTSYCLNHDKAEQLLEKFEGLPDQQKVRRRGSLSQELPRIKKLKKMAGSNIFGSISFSVVARADCEAPRCCSKGWSS